MDVGKVAWYRNRRYLHFDLPVGPAKAARVATSVERVTKHSFYPLISYEVNKKKIKKDSTTGRISTQNKPRPIKYAAHMDSHIYAYFAYELSKKYELDLVQRGLSKNVLAFRPLGKSNIEFAGEVFDEIRSRGDCGVVALDITAFFDNLAHNLLKERISKLLGAQLLPEHYFQVYKSITRFSYVNKGDLYDRLGISKNNPRKNRQRICTPREFRNIVRREGLIQKNNSVFGIPQGTPISALLSNIYMLEFDQLVSKVIEERGGAYFRYCDDMLVIVPNEWRDNVADFIRREIKKLKIDINPAKTELVRFRTVKGDLIANRPLQYLGFTFDGQRTLIRSAALAKYSERMKKAVRLASSTRRKVNEVRTRRGLKQREIFKRKLYSRYSYLGKRNFITYGHRAATTLKSSAIRKQLKPLWKRLQKEIDRYS